jgi:ABC-type transporter Mla subunit MlaD
MARKPRNEVRTGALVILSLTVLVAALVWLGAPGAFVKQHHYFIYFDNAFGIKPGADVMVSGRKAGKVKQVFSPVPVDERPEPRYECVVEVSVEAKAHVFKSVHVQMQQLSMLGDMVIDFSEGDETSGLAEDRAHFLGQRAPGLSEVAQQALDRVDPVLHKATEALETIEKAGDNLKRLTAESGDLALGVAEFRKAGMNLNEMTSSSSPLRLTLDHVEQLTGPEGPLSNTLKNAERFTADLTSNHDLQVALRNTRHASEKLNLAVTDAAPRVSVIARNLEEATDTIKRQPWRLVWPGNKSYPGDESPTPAPRATATKRR